MRAANQYDRARQPESDRNTWSAPILRPYIMYYILDKPNLQPKRPTLRDKVLQRRQKYLRQNIHIPS